MKQFKSKQLAYFIANYKSHKFSGVLNIQVQAPQLDKPRKRVIAFHKGWMTYAGEQLRSAPELATLLGVQLKVQVMDSALKLAKKRITSSSIQDYLELLVRLQIFTWAEVQSYMQTRLLGILEQLIPYDGVITEEPELTFDLQLTESQPGFRWCDLQPFLEQRQQQWTALAPAIPSIEAIPRIKDITSADTDTTQYLRKWIDGQHSLVDISINADQDPLKLAQLYYKWTKVGWLTFEESRQPEAELTSSARQTGFQPDDSGKQIVLSVDDSSVVQTMIKRAIQDCYQVVLANNAVDALNLLNSNDISLVLLDVTMPGIDGLELCRTIRSISKFHDLPVVMLTAKDGVFNKLKGQMAGATHYLSKPITQDKLLEVLNRYVPNNVKA